MSNLAADIAMSPGSAGSAPLQKLLARLRAVLRLRHYPGQRRRRVRAAMRWMDDHVRQQRWR